MTHIVTDACIGCKYTDCVEMCPVDCFHEGPNFMVIDPEECIDCGLCVSECPVGAIKPWGELLKNELPYVHLNRQLSKVWPIKKEKSSPLDCAEDFRDKKNKISYLQFS